MKTKLPFFRETDSSIDRERYERYKEKTREGNGLRRQHTICIGDKVLVRQKKRNKLTPAFSPEMYTVTRVKGSMITGRRGKHEVTRDASMFKKLAEKREVYSNGKRRVVKYKEGNREWHQGKNSGCEEGGGGMNGLTYYVTFIELSKLIPGAVLPDSMNSGN